MTSTRTLENSTSSVSKRPLRSDAPIRSRAKAVRRIVCVVVILFFSAITWRWYLSSGLNDLETQLVGTWVRSGDQQLLQLKPDGTAVVWNGAASAGRSVWHVDPKTNRFVSINIRSRLLKAVAQMARQKLDVDSYPLSVSSKSFELTLPNGERTVYMRWPVE